MLQISYRFTEWGISFIFEMENFWVETPIGNSGKNNRIK